MKIKGIVILITLLLSGCNTEAGKNQKENNITTNKEENSENSVAFDEALPTIGLLLYNGVLMTEVTAPMDVFSKHTEAGDKLFNVVTIAENLNPVKTEEGLVVVPDYTFENAPKLDVLFVPSAYDMWSTVRNDKIVAFVKNRNKETKYTVSNCAGAQLIGASGIAKGKKIVTYIGGGKQLQKDYPELLVQNDSLVSFVEDGKFSSSNGNLATYISSLELVEKMTSKAHREFVESYLYLDRLKDWESEKK
ncbi:DJ-1/PfpI family protein [Galbibacter pacificus]|uniref:DJ-1/PfpI family protein n=1 Tax=Galbibacter pacificus TaxID=2996052 RepID=A0ABT6FTE6_9FLAO|nr:DJ-1/PfpI family protein [Galbibacter pacificus]MDG3583050.1 DJ-1/PfpI family protein [Galbibacter pacificus]MDG3586531.1 DJ-1/PfpI family protein [Galbibacter pacificus]